MADKKMGGMAWTSMIGMAGMFVATICIGIFIQPAWNFEGAKPSKEGSTEAKNIIFELIMIFLSQHS